MPRADDRREIELTSGTVVSIVSNRTKRQVIDESIEDASVSSALLQWVHARTLWSGKYRKDPHTRIQTTLVTHS